MARGKRLLLREPLAESFFISRNAASGPIALGNVEADAKSLRSGVAPVLVPGSPWPLRASMYATSGTARGNPRPTSCVFQILSGNAHALLAVVRMKSFQSTRSRRKTGG